MATIGFTTPGTMAANLWQKLTISTAWQKPRCGPLTKNWWKSASISSCSKPLAWHGIFVVEKLGLVNLFVRKVPFFVFASIRKSKKRLWMQCWHIVASGSLAVGCVSWFFHLRTEVKTPRKSLLRIAFSGHDAPVREHLLASERRAPWGTRCCESEITWDNCPLVI